MIRPPDGASPAPAREGRQAILPPGPYLVLGTGRAGRSAVAALAERGAGPIRAWDAYDGPETWGRREALERLGAEVALGPWDAALLAGPVPRTVVKSPGIPADAEPVRAALARGVAVIDELELGVRLSRRELLAVTGTDGKSTVAHLLAAALGPDTPVAGNTEFGEPLSAVTGAGGPVVVEVSSYQLEFTAPAFPRLAVLTNVTTEHLHRHGTLAGYAEIKRRLFAGDGRTVPLAVVKADDPFGAALGADLRRAGARVADFGRAAGAYRAVAVTSTIGGATVEVATPEGALVLRTRLPGRHNADNALACLAACDLLGLDRAAAIAAIEGVPGLPGRWDRVGGAPFEVIVDFAHTPAALEAVLTTARELAEGGAVHVVVSASGLTTPGKRGPLGAVAARLADRVIVTEAGLGGEAGETVMATIVAGTEGGPAAVDVVGDRREAIRAALAGAAPGDIVLVNDRGVRPVFITDPAGGGAPWDDRAVVREELSRLHDVPPR